MAEGGGFVSIKPERRICGVCGQAGACYALAVGGGAVEYICGPCYRGGILWAARMARREALDVLPVGHPLRRMAEAPASRCDFSRFLVGDRYGISSDGDFLGTDGKNLGRVVRKFTDARGDRYADVELNEAGREWQRYMAAAYLELHPAPGDVRPDATVGEGQS